MPQVGQNLNGTLQRSASQKVLEGVATRLSDTPLVARQIDPEVLQNLWQVFVKRLGGVGDKGVPNSLHALLDFWAGVKLIPIKLGYDFVQMGLQLLTGLGGDGSETKGSPSFRVPNYVVAGMVTGKIWWLYQKTTRLQNLMLWLLRRLLDDKTEQLRPLILRPIYTRQYIVMKSCRHRFFYVAGNSKILQILNHLCFHLLKHICIHLWKHICIISWSSWNTFLFRK